MTTAATNIHAQVYTPEEQDQQIGDVVRRERSRLRDFIRRRMPDPDAAEDVLQDVFFELTEAYRLTKPIERVASWLFAVARNKINDWYRRPKTLSLDQPLPTSTDEPDESLLLTDWLALASGGPEEELWRETFLDALADALAELPADQREIFVRHELEGESFKAIAADLGVPVNTLLSRKHYAVVHLREQLRDLYEEGLIG
ncbi:RNA polymerase sigma factor [Nibrella viscosa]|uniref:RNA polymerase sigma factor n=1 Tax=Nibrella viscosa TaxID=1084524 RepID=A0ABP8KNV8_9BACT